MIIVIEGGDQAGKLTQSVLLEKSLKKQKIKTKLFHFPDYDTPIGKEIRKYLDGERKFPPQVIHCLLAANRWEKLNEIGYNNKFWKNNPIIKRTPVEKEVIADFEDKDAFESIYINSRNQITFNQKAVEMILSLKNCL